MKSATTLPPHRHANWMPPYTGPLYWQHLAGWMLTLIAVAISYKYAAAWIAPALEKLYELLIQKNVLGL